MRSWFGRKKLVQPPALREAEVHRFRGRRYVTAGWGRGFGVVVPADAGPGEVSRLVVEALEWSGRNPLPVFTRLGKRDPGRRDDERGWERFCRSIVGVAVPDYDPEQRVRVLAQDGGRLQLCLIACGTPVTGTEVYVAAGADGTAVGQAVEYLMARHVAEPPPLPRPDPAITGEGFGYKTGWYAVRTGDMHVVADVLGLTARRSVQWSEGVALSYRSGVFITPPVGNWVLAVGVDLAKRECDAESLSGVLATEVQYFATHRGSEAHEWHLADNGRLARVIRYAADAGIYRQVGEPTEGEVGLGFGLASLTEESALEPISEDTVMQVAGAWSVNPQHLPVTDELGIYGHIEAA